GITPTGATLEPSQALMNDDFPALNSPTTATRRGRSRSTLMASSSPRSARSPEREASPPSQPKSAGQLGRSNQLTASSSSSSAQLPGPAPLASKPSMRCSGGSALDLN